MNNKINGKTPEEIKKGLECCASEYTPETYCDGCPYGRMGICGNSMLVDALALIQQLERERDEVRNDLDTLNYAVTELHGAYEAMKRERDAAVKDMKDATWCGCHVCGHYYRPDPAVREYACRKFGSFKEHDYIADDGSMFCGAFEWRGVPKEVE